MSSSPSSAPFRTNLFLFLVIFLTAFSFGRLYRSTEEDSIKHAVGLNFPRKLCKEEKPVEVVAPVFESSLSSATFIHRTEHFNRRLLEKSSNRIFPELTFWSTDFHITPIADLKFLFKSFQIKIIDKSLSGSCGSRGTCAQNLRVLNRDNGYHIGDSPQHLSRQLFEAYKNDPEFQRVDAIVCFHPIVTCQLYLPFNKSIIMISSTRYEHGQSGERQWHSFNRIVQKLSENPRHLIAGNSVYDADYIQYFTGVPALYIPSFCGQITARYNPIKPEFLLAHSHVSKNSNSYWEDGSLVWKFAVENLNQAKMRKGGEAEKFQFKGINELYGHYEYQDLANHPVMIHFPYQVSVMSFFEQYRMNLPIFVPSLKFLVKLHMEYGVVSERTWARIYGHGAREKSEIPGHEKKLTPHDPNNEKSEEALLYWMSKADYYVKPHIQYFDSWDDLIEKLLTTDLRAISALMEQHNVQFHAELLSQWQTILGKLFENRPSEGYKMPDSYDIAMKELYGWNNEYQPI